MLHQSLHLNSTIGAWSQLCAGLRSENRGSLSDLNISAASIVFDLARAAGIPDNGLGFILSKDELDALGVELEPSDTKCLCQHCGMEEAMHLVPVRGTWVLLCVDCECTTRKGRK